MYLNLAACSYIRTPTQQQARDKQSIYGGKCHAPVICLVVEENDSIKTAVARNFTHLFNIIITLEKNTCFYEFFD